MFNRQSTFLLLLTFVIVLAVSCSKTEKEEAKKETAQQPAIQQPDGPLIGKKAADFKLTDLNGNTVTLDNYKDKVIMLNFWATWCGPCRVEIPDFIKMTDKYKDDGLVIVGIGGFREDLNKIKPFVKENGMNYPILFVEPENIQSLVDSYGGIRGIPTTFLIDKDGIIRHKWVGPRSEEVFMEEINKYM